MTNETALSKVRALENAAAFIENHGEEGGIYQDDYDVPVSKYLKECKNVAKLLFKKADKIKAKYNIK